MISEAQLVIDSVLQPPIVSNSSIHGTDQQSLATAQDMVSRGDGFS